MKSPRSYTNTEKAALTLLSLGKDVAAEVMKGLSEAEVKRLSRAFMRLSEVPREDQLLVANEFRKLMESGEKLLVDGKQFARDVLEQAFGSEATEFISGAEDGNRQAGIDDLVSEIPMTLLESFFTAEHPQTIAFLITKVHPDRAALVLQSLPEDVQTDILLRVANLNAVKVEVLDEVREVLRSLLTQQGNAEQAVDGPKAAADILNYVERANEERILSDMEETHPDLSEHIRNLMFTFDDLLKVDDKGIQTLLKEVSREQLVLALKQTSDPLKQLLLSNMSKRAAEMILEEVESLGKVKRKDVEKAQQVVVDIARRLEAEGKLVLSTGGEEEQYV